MSILDNINSANDTWFILIRTAIIYIFAIILFRFFNSRFRLQTPFDFVVIVIIGAVLGRTIYGGSSLINTVCASLLIVLLHELFAKLSYAFKTFGFLVKGKPKILVENGKIQWQQMRSNNITEDDLKEVCHKELHIEDLNSFKKAILERSGEITVIKSKN